MANNTSHASHSLECALCGNVGATPFLRAPDRFHGRNVEYELVRCPACSIVWQENPPSLAEISQHYGPLYHRAITQAAATSPERWQRHKNIVQQQKPSGTLLDLGCSAGSFLAACKGENWKLYGVEISAAEAGQARQRTGADVFVGDVLEAPFPPESFDVITCFDVLEHVYRPREMMQRVQQWLKPGGIFYTVLPNIQSWEARLLGSYWYGLEMPRHLFHFSPKSFRLLAQSVGLREVELKTPPISYLEYSMGYLAKSAAGKLGIACKPLAEATPPGIPWRVVRKLIRIFAFAPFCLLASAAGQGPSMEAIVVRPGPQ